MKKIFFLLAIAFFAALTSKAQMQFKALIVTTARGWHHESIHYGVLALKKLGEKHHFETVLMHASYYMSDEYLANFKVVIFLNTTGDIFDTAQQKAFERFIKKGGGYVGIHSASDTEYDWEWYTRLVGRMFVIHPPNQTARLLVTNENFPGNKSFVNNQLWTDEWYEFGPEKISGLKYLLAVDEKTYDPNITREGIVGKGMGSFHPISWYHEYDGGRSFYTALGHMPAVFEDEAFLNHLYGGIFWAATGKK